MRFLGVGPRCGPRPSGVGAMNEESVFAEALERPPAERAAFLQRACGTSRAAHGRRGVAGGPRAIGRTAGEAAIRTGADGGSRHGRLDRRRDAGSHADARQRTGPDPDRRGTPDRRGHRRHRRPLYAREATRRRRYGRGLGRPADGAGQSKVALKLIKAGMDSQAVLARFDQERQALAMMDHPNIAARPRWRPDADRPAVLRHGAGQRPAADEVLRRGQADAPRAARALRADLPGGAACPPEGHRPPRPQAGQHPGDADRRPADAEGDRLRRGQGHGGQADRRIAGHPVRRRGRHAGIHGARAGGLLRRRHRHAGRHLLAGRDPLRAADRAAADGCPAPEDGGDHRDDPDDPRGGAVEAQHPAVHRRSLPSLAALRRPSRASYPRCAASWTGW